MLRARRRGLGAAHGRMVSPRRHLLTAAAVWVVLSVIGVVLVAGMQIIPVIASREAEIENGAFVLLTAASVPVLMLVVVGLAYSALRFRSTRRAGGRAAGPRAHRLPGGVGRHQLRAGPRPVRVRCHRPGRDPGCPGSRLPGEHQRRAVGLAFRVSSLGREVERAAHPGRSPGADQHHVDGRHPFLLGAGPRA